MKSIKMMLTAKACALGKDLRKNSAPSLFSLKLFIKIHIEKSAQIIIVQLPELSNNKHTHIMITQIKRESITINPDTFLVPHPSLYAHPFS